MNNREEKDECIIEEETPNFLYEDRYDEYMFPPLNLLKQDEDIVGKNNEKRNNIPMSSILASKEYHNSLVSLNIC